MRIAEFCCGIGGIAKGFSSLSTNIVYACDTDKYCAQTYKLNHNIDVDTTDLTTKNIDHIPDFDLLLAGFPCQAFSIAGQRKGFADERGDIIFSLIKIIDKKRPRFFFLENVKNITTHNSGQTFKIILTELNNINYKVKYFIVNSKDYTTIPQNRERVYICGFRDQVDYDKFSFAPIKQAIRPITDFLQKEVNKKYYYDCKSKIYDLLEKSVTKHISTNTIYQYRRTLVRENKSSVCPTLTANMGTGGHNVPIILTDQGIRKLTPQEAFALQGYADIVLPKISDGQLYKQAGNSVCVDVIRLFADQYKLLDKI